MEKKIKKLNKIKELYKQLFANSKSIIALDSKIVVAEKEIIEGNSKYRKVLEKYGKCPICQSEITEDILKEIKL